MRQTAANLVVTLALASSCLLALGSDGKSTTRIAVIPGEGERAPAEAALVLIETMLSTNASLALVERQQIRQILSEHKITLAGLASPGTAARVGQLLSADLFLFVQKVPGDTNRVLRLRMVESRTGIALSHAAATEEAWRTNATPVVAAVCEAMAKAQVPAGERHYVGVLGFRSEEIGRSLDALAMWLEAWFPLDLSAATNIILLDREHLDRLTQEQQLTGLELELKTSAVLVQGTLKRGVDLSNVVVRFSLQSFSQRTPEVFTVQVPNPELRSRHAETQLEKSDIQNPKSQIDQRLLASAVTFQSIRRTLAKAVWDKLNVAAQALGHFDPEREAALFAVRANTHYSDREYEAAARAAEAAFALAPTPERRLRTAELWCEAARQAKALAESKGVSRDHRGHPRLPTEAKLQVLRHVARAGELYREVIEIHLAKIRRQITTSNPPDYTQFPAMKGTSFAIDALQLPVEPDESEARELRRELQQQSIALFRLERDYWAGLWNSSPNEKVPSQHPQFRWGCLLADSLFKLQEWAGNANEWARLMREVIANYQNPPGPFTCTDQYGAQPGRIWFWHDAAWCAPTHVFTSSEERRVILDVVDSFGRQPDPALRLAALNAARAGRDRIDGSPNPVRAREFLDIFIREFPYTHPVRRRDDDCQFPALFISSAIAEVEDVAALEKYGRAILEPILKARDGVRLNSWENLVTQWLGALEQNGKAGEACERARE